MGAGAEILLVGLRLAAPGRRCAGGLLLALALALPASAGTVRAPDYDAFWLWAGVKPQPVLAGARTLYILQGQVAPRSAADDEGRLVAQVGAVPHLRRGEIWLDYRAHTLRWPPVVYAQMLARLGRWRAAGDPVVGLQIDFDSGTRHLADYAAFLRDLRGRLPADCRLSVTGLLDWSSQGDSVALGDLGGVADEVVLQTYQGRHTIPGYQAYLARLSRMTIPFKIGLVEGGDWTAPPGLAANPWFRGYVVFLKNP
ncbi:MAG TPA: DUF3142 domain-containing protein [Caulobacteraceae bacterium]|jgi:hypothetical protein